jgi:hypothetical protein
MCRGLPASAGRQPHLVPHSATPSARATRAPGRARNGQYAQRGSRIPIQQVDIHSRRPRTTVTIRWLLTVCDATTRPAQPWVGLPTARGPAPAAQGAAAAGPGRQGRRHNLSAMCPEPGRRSRPVSGTALPAAAQAGRSSLGPGPKLIWSTATYLFCRRCSTAARAAPTLQQVRAPATMPGWPCSLW